MAQSLAIQLKEDVEAIRTTYGAIVAANIRKLDYIPHRVTYNGDFLIGHTLLIIDKEFDHLFRDNSDWTNFTDVNESLLHIRGYLQVLGSSLSTYPTALHRRLELPLIRQQLVDLIQRIDLLVISLQWNPKWQRTDKHVNLRLNILPNISQIIGGTICNRKNNC
jgi:hypothetical protein